MAAKGTKRPMRTLSHTEKHNAILRVHAGESKASVARDIGVPESTLRGWCKNEVKISYAAKQEDSLDSDESVEHPKKKKPKLEEPASQPFNLSLKSSGGSFSPTSALDYTKKGDTVSKPAANLATIETPKTANGHMTESERNRAELARLSVVLGLNRQEMFMPNANNSSASMADLSSNFNLLAQWNTMMMQQQQRAMQSGQTNKVSAPADTSTSGMTSPSVGLLTTVDKEKAKQMQLPREKQSVHESVWYWLRQHSMNAPAQTPTTTGINGNGISSSSMSPPTTTTATSSTSPGLNGMTPDQSSWLWNWYKQFAYYHPEQQLVPPQQVPPQQVPPQQGPQPQDTKPILYQQLTKDVQINHVSPRVSPPLHTPPDQQNAENLSMRDAKNKVAEKTNSKARSVLDSLLFNNNNNVALNKKSENLEVDNLSRTEAVEYGEKFVNWLESCSDPSVTAIQIMQFRTVINNLKINADRKNGDLQNKAKVKRK